MASLGISRTDRTPATAIETAARRHIDQGATGCPARAADQFGHVLRRDRPRRDRRAADLAVSP